MSHPEKSRRTPEAFITPSPKNHTQRNVCPVYVADYSGCTIYWTYVLGPNPYFSEKLLSKLLWPERSLKVNVSPSPAGHLFFDRIEKFVFKKKLVRKKSKIWTKDISSIYNECSVLISNNSPVRQIHPKGGSHVQRSQNIVFQFLLF